MTKRQMVSKNIEFGFDLTRYLMTHPSVAQKYDIENFVVFTEDNKALNKGNENLLKEMVKKGKDVVKAIKKKGVKNEWRFEMISA